MNQILTCINFQKSSEYGKTPQLPPEFSPTALLRCTKDTLTIQRKVKPEDGISLLPSFSQRLRDGGSRGASVVVRLWSSSGSWLMSYLIRSVPSKQILDLLVFPLRAQEESPSTFLRPPKKRARAPSRDHFSPSHSHRGSKKRTPTSSWNRPRKEPEHLPEAT